MSEASKIYAEQKEDEVRILEHSIEELEHTINMMEKKVIWPLVRDSNSFGRKLIRYVFNFQNLIMITTIIYTWLACNPLKSTFL